jgi:putative ABC transport system permease protein
METLLKDLRYAIRVFTKNPAFTAVAVLALAIGIGANTAIFSVVNAILLRSLPYTDPERLVMVWMNNTRISVDEDWHSYPNYMDYKEQNQTFEDIAVFNDRRFNLTGGGGDPERVIAAWSTANLFPLLGVEAARGRTYAAEEEEPGRDLVVVLGHGLWQRRYGGDPDIIGQSIELNGTQRTVIGVMPQDFRFPSKETELWVPLSGSPQIKAQRQAFWLKAIGRLKPGVTMEQARADMTGIADRLQQDYNSMGGYGVNLVPLHNQIVGAVLRSMLLLLAGAVAFVLLIACVNVANLMLARAAAREREIAIRTALGAGRWRLVRQLLTESMLLSLVGGMVGLLLAIWGLDVLIALSPKDIPRLEQISIDRTVLLFTLGVSVLTGLIFGIVPALQASRPDLNESLKEGGRGSSGGPSGRRIRNGLVVVEIALSLVLLVGAGLMIKSFLRLQDVNLGFNPDNLLMARVQLSGNDYREAPRRAAFFQEALRRIESLPGVESTAAVSTIFLTKTPNSTIFTIEGRPPFAANEAVEVPLDAVTPNYFKVMGIRLVSGREFTEADAGEQTNQVAIINETMANRFWPNEDPLGKRFKYGSEDSEDTWKTIVGVVGDVRRTGFDSEVRPETFLPHGQAPFSEMTLVVRASSNPSGLAGPLRSEIWAIDKNRAIYDIKTMDQQLSEMVAQRRLNMLLFTILAAVALVLAAVGIYGVVSYSVSERTHEIGIRIALGAKGSDILKMVVGQSMMLALIGVGIGIVVALAVAFTLTRAMHGLLYEVSATDPVTFAVISVVLALVVLAACYVPARRATRVDPMVALRYE